MIHEFPYSDFHEMNLDWILEEVKNLKESINNFEITNKLHIEGSWSITKAYQAYSIVTNGNLGYISTQAVPAGIAISNTDYWQNIADFTALYADLGTRVSNLETSVNKLNNLNQGWANHKMLFIGDSYGRGRTYPNTYGESWVDGVVSKLNLSAYYNMSVSSSAFATSQDLKYGKQLETFKNNHTASECNAITDIVIAGGYNETFAPSVNIVNDGAIYAAPWMNSYIKTNFPNAKVYIAFIGRVPKFGGANATFNNFRDVIQNYKNVAAKFNWHYITGSENISHLYEQLTSDGIHFKTAGYLEIGRRLADGINNGSWTYPQTSGEKMSIIPMADTSNNSIVVTNAPDVYNQYSDNGVILFTNGACRFECNATNINSASTIKLGKYYDVSSEVYNHFVTNFDYRIPCSYAMYKNGSPVSTIKSGMINFTNAGEILLIPASFESGDGTVNTDLIYINFPYTVLPYSVC